MTVGGMASLAHGVVRRLRALAGGPGARAAAAGRRGIAFVYAAALAGAASTVSLSVAGGGTLWTSAPMIETNATRMVASVDDTPARVLLVPRRNLAPGQGITANTIRLSGISVPVGIAAAGAGAEVSVAGGAFTAGPIVAERGQPILLRATAPGVGETATVTLTTGTVESEWVLQSAASASYSHQTLYGPWGACDAARPCDGMGTQSREILCLRSDGRFVAVTDCAPALTASEHRSCPSPAGTAACVPTPALAEGSPSQYCAAGSAVRSTCSGFTCPAPYMPQDGACVSTRQSLPVITVSADPQLREDAGTLTLTARLDYVAPVALDLPVSLAAGSGADQADVVGGPWMLTIPAGQSQGSVTLAIVDDTISEPDEALVLSVDSPGSGATLAPGSAQIRVTLIDDDTVPEAILSAAADTVGEGEALAITVRLTRARAQTVTVPVSLSGAVGDVTLTPASAVFAPGALSATLSLAAAADGLHEPTAETVTLSVGQVSPAGAAVAGAPLAIAVLDRDPRPTVSLIGPDQAAEGTSSRYTLRLSGPTAAAASATWAVAHQTTSAGDLNLAGGTVDWGPGDSGDRDIDLLAIVDGWEGPESFQLAVTAATGADAAPAAPLTVTVPEAAARPQVAFAGQTSGLSWTEGTTPAALSVALSGPTTQAVQVPWSVSPAAQFTTASGTLSWAAGTSGSQALGLVAVNDAAFELPQGFTVTLGPPTGGPALGSPAVATGTLGDDDLAPALSLATSPTQATEGTSASWTVTLAAPAVDTVTATVAVVPGSGLTTAMFSPASRQVTWTPGQSGVQTVDFRLVDDASDGGNRNFTLQLSATGTVRLTGGAASVTWLENDVDLVGSGTDAAPFQWSGGRFATTCQQYRSPPAGTDAATTSGIYWVKPDSAAAFKVFCDMTTAGGGWTLIANRRADSTNTESCGGTFNGFMQNACGAPHQIAASQSYSLGRTNRLKLGATEVMQLQYLNGTLDSDDANITRFAPGTDPWPNQTSCSYVAATHHCNIDNSSCDTTSVLWVYCGTSWFHSAYCSHGFAFPDQSYLGDYGVCHNGVSIGYNANSLFGNRSQYQEIKLWGHPSSSVPYQERIFMR